MLVVLISDVLNMFFFDRAFRPFFLGGSLFSVVVMVLWFANYPQQIMPFSGVAPMFWHAHEMVFGYALATVTGFLLTAVMNWSGERTASGKPLVILLLLWAAARLGYLLNFPINLIAIADIGFNVGLFLLFFIPVYRQKLWVQIGLASKFFLLIIANTLFYAGVLGWWEHGEQAAIILGLFLVLAINLTMIRRLVPFFTEKALKLAEFRSSKLVDGVALGGFLALMLVAAFTPQSWLMAVIAFPLAMLHALRLVWWYHPGIWQVTLLWPLHLSYLFMIIGILMFGFAGLGWVSSSIAIHALAAGGIGLLCSSMMARISLGHTNRNVFAPPRGVVWVFVLLALTAVVRVFFPLVLPEYYLIWIGLSQIGWVAAFLLLTVLYLPILWQPNLPKHPGLER